MSFTKNLWPIIFIVIAVAIYNNPQPDGSEQTDKPVVMVESESALAAIEALREIKFIKTTAGATNYDMNVLAAASSHDIRSYIEHLGSESNKNVVFALKVAGSNLRNPTQRKDFVKRVLVNDPSLQDYLALMNSVLLTEPKSPAVIEAFHNVVEEMSYEQTYLFLRKIGFANFDSMSSYGESIHQTFNRQTISHLTPKNVNALKSSLDQAPSIGGGVYRRAAGQL
jgi:hypothetical protein